MMHALLKCLIFHLLTCLGLHALGSEIIKGKKTKEKSMLYMASLQNKSGHHVCGGFLINKEFVVTAAHCDDMNPTSVVLGTHNLKKVDDGTMRYDVKKKDRCKHPSYVSVSEGNDIMLLKLSKKVQLNKKVQPILLTKPGHEIKEKEKCRVAGWGSTSTNGAVEDVLQDVDVSFINRNICEKRWGHLPANVICAGGYGTDKGFCQGDSGGPLVCSGKAVGVVSYNSNQNCDYPDVPNVYTEISKYLDWIKKILKRKKC